MSYSDSGAKLVSREIKKMATLNGFSVQVPERVSEDSKGYVKIRHGQQYTIRLHNSHRGPYGCLPADVEVFIDGKPMGNFRVQHGQSVTLERSPHDSGKFTAFKADSVESDLVGLDSHDRECGLIRAVFRPGRVRCPVPQIVDSPLITYRWNCENPVRGFNVQNCCFGGNVSPAGTGLTGTSYQSFRDAEPLDYVGGDTTIYLRLVVVDGCYRAVPLGCPVEVPSRCSNYPRPLR